jgi:hypothetical protein
LFDFVGLPYWIIFIFPVEVLVLFDLGHLLKLGFESLKGSISPDQFLLDGLELVATILEVLESLRLVDLVFFVILLAFFVNVRDPNCCGIVLTP